MRAHVREGVVTELLQEVVTLRADDGTEHSFSLVDRYTPDFLAAAHAVPLEQETVIQPGWTCADGVFAAPVAVAPVVPGPRYVPVYLARERLEAAGKWDTLVAALSSDMPKLVKMLTLQTGLASDDAEVIGVLQAIGADPDAVLAP